MLDIWPAIICSSIIAVACLVLGSGLLYRGTSLSASPLVLCSVTGLLIGIAMLVVLPQAFESLLTKEMWPAERIFALFISAPLIMFFLEHVIIDHQHVHAGGPGGGPEGEHTVHDENCDHGPNIPYAMRFTAAKEAGESTPLQPAEKEASGRCEDFGCVSPPAPRRLRTPHPQQQLEPRALTSTDPPARRLCRLLLRLWAWMMHAMLDGVLIGSADQLAVLIPLSFAILICAIQDVAGLYIYFDARGATTHFVAIALVLFSIAFPIGAGISLVVFRVQPAPLRCRAPSARALTQRSTGGGDPAIPSQGRDLDADPQPVLPLAAGLEGKRPGARRIALRDGWPLRVHGPVRACTPARARPGPKPEILLRVQLRPHVGIHG